MDLNVFWASLTAGLSRFALDFFTAVAILVAGWYLSRLVERVVRRFVERSSGVTFDYTPALARIARGAVFLVAAVVALGQLGVQTASITALVGAAGLAIGLALQGTLSNVAAGIMVMILRPFKLGDGIEIGTTAGTVTDIGLFITRVVTWDGVVVHLPNSTVWGTKIINYSQSVRRRFDLVVSVSYGDDVARALELLTEVVTSDPRVLTHPAPLFTTKALTDLSVDILAQYWTTAADFLTTQSDLKQKVKERFDAEGFTVPLRQVQLAPR